MTKDEDLYFDCQKCGEHNHPGVVICKKLQKPSYYRGEVQNEMLKLVCRECGAYRKFLSPHDEEAQFFAEDEQQEGAFDF